MGFNLKRALTPPKKLRGAITKIVGGAVSLIPGAGAVKAAVGAFSGWGSKLLGGVKSLAAKLSGGASTAQGALSGAEQGAANPKMASLPLWLWPVAGVAAVVGMFMLFFKPKGRR